MGTRSITNVVDENGDVYVSLYRQFDGYPSGHGKELADWLEGAIIGNGISSNPPSGFFNGVGDLACRLVSFFKDDHNSIGSFYLVPPGSGWGADYTYTLTGVDPGFSSNSGATGSITIKVDHYSEETVFLGSIEEFNIWANDPETD